MLPRPSCCLQRHPITDSSHEQCCCLQHRLTTCPAGLTCIASYILLPTLSGVVIAPFFLVCQLKPSLGLPAEEGTCPELDLAQQAERVLFIGWRRAIADLIQVLDDFVAPGSELWLYNEV